MSSGPGSALDPESWWAQAKLWVEIAVSGVYQLWNLPENINEWNVATMVHRILTTYKDEVVTICRDPVDIERHDAKLTTHLDTVTARLNSKLLFRTLNILCRGKPWMIEKVGSFLGY